jgi:hypothetical protein
LLRGQEGVEAFDVAGRPIGVFPSQKLAANALSASAKEASNG